MKEGSKYYPSCSTPFVLLFLDQNVISECSVILPLSAFAEVISIGLCLGCCHKLWFSKLLLWTYFSAWDFQK